LDGRLGTMMIPWVRSFCLALPHATEDMKWGNDLTFSIGGKMFAVLNLEPGGKALSFKCTPEKFAGLVERPGMIPAPYLARAHWVALEEAGALPKAELQGLLREAYAQVRAKLPKRVQAEFTSFMP
jgi:predicted DNA-binding protein (MmcQ/YjbR family)